MRSMTEWFEHYCKTGRWHKLREAGENVFSLPDVDGSVFGAYFHWIHTGDFQPEFVTREPGGCEVISMSQDDEQELYIELYLLGGYLPGI